MYWHNKKWLEFESIGGFGMGIFDIAPVIVKAEGSYLYDAAGKQYLDFLSGFSYQKMRMNF